jgi:hypothetical protein
MMDREITIWWSIVIGGSVLIVIVGLLIFFYRYSKSKPSLGKCIWYIIVALIAWFVGMLFTPHGV